MLYILLPLITALKTSTTCSDTRAGGAFKQANSIAPGVKVVNEYLGGGNQKYLAQGCLIFCVGGRDYVVFNYSYVCGLLIFQLTSPYDREQVYVFQVYRYSSKDTRTHTLLEKLPQWIKSAIIQISFKKKMRDANRIINC